MGTIKNQRKTLKTNCDCNEFLYYIYWFYDCRTNVLYAEWERGCKHTVVST